MDFPYELTIKLLEQLQDHLHLDSTITCFKRCKEKGILFQKSHLRKR